MKYKVKEFFYQQRYLFLSFLCCASILTLVLALRRIYPFGDRTILRVDLFHQYAPFLEELRSRILNGQSLMYSWEGGLGKEFLSQFAYYTASPISFLILLFPQSALPETMAFFICLKICLSSVSCSFYLREHFKKNDLSILIFGLLYAFCAFMTGFYWNVMWLDSVALFPLIALAVEKLIHENKHVFYYVTLTITIIVNFYMAVLVCIFTAFWYLIVLFSGYTWKQDSDIMIRRSIKFAVMSILAAVSSLFILLPVSAALGQTATSEASFPELELYRNIFQLFTCHFIGARPSVLARNEDFPNLYTGLLTLLLLPAYYTSPAGEQAASEDAPSRSGADKSCLAAGTREKILITALLAFMLLCSCIKPLDFMIHGFHFPANLPHRYTFVYSFVLLYLAYSGFLRLRECPYRYLLGTGVFYAAGILIFEYLIIPLVPEIDHVLSNTDIAVNLFAIAVYLLLLKAVCSGNEKNRKPLLTILLLCTLAECAFASYEGMDDTGNHAAYIAYMDSTGKALDAIAAQESDLFYRTEYRRFTTINDASVHHYNGFSQFSSLAPKGISEFVSALGIAATGNSYRYYDPTPLIDAMFNIKYVLNKDLEYRKDRYQLLDSFGNVYVYRNDQVLPLGFLANTEIADWQTSGSQPFAVQNEFARKAAGIDRDMFTMLPLEHVTHDNMEVTELSDGPACFNYRLTHPEDLSLLPTVTAEYTSDRDQYLFLYVDAANAKRFIYHTGHSDDDRELSAGRSLMDIGHVSAGEKVTIEFTVSKKGEFERTYRKEGTVKLYLASYDDAVFQDAFRILNGQGMTITGFSDTAIEGIVSAPDDMTLFTSIPFTKGWSARIDGAPADITSLGNGGVIGLNVPEGDHIISFSYHRKEYLPSVILSLLGILLAIGYTIWDDHTQKKETAAVS